MNPTSKDVCSLLEADSSLGLVIATNLFVGKEPASPDDCVTVFDIPGDSPSLTLTGKGGGVYYQPSIQIRVRNNNYVTGWELMHDIREFLHGMNNITEDGTEYLLIRSVDEPALLDWDENNRARFITTFSIQRR